MTNNHVKDINKIRIFKNSTSFTVQNYFNDSNILERKGVFPYWRHLQMKSEMYIAKT